MAPRALVLGSTGMLGSALLREFLRLGVDATGTTRRLEPTVTGAPLRQFDVHTGDLDDTLTGFESGDYIINCVGVIKHLMRDEVAADRLRAVEVNAAFPYRLAAAAEARGMRVLQIATDCVYSGAKGGYDEAADHDAVDVYGQSKSLGEVPSDCVLNLRSSIIGPEVNSSTSLLEWVLSQPHGATINGFTDHHWNGVTTLAFARVAAGIVLSGDPLSGTRHLVPADTVSKAELIRRIAAAFGREDLIVDDVTTQRPVDRTLSTVDEDLNRRLWLQGGYSTPPRIAEMIADVAMDHA